MFLDVLGELQPPTPSAPENPVNHWKDDHRAAWEEIQSAPEGQRRLELGNADPAFATPLRGFVIDVLTRAQGVGLGPYWDRADAGAKSSLEKFLA